MYKVQNRRKKKIKQSRCACGHCSLHRDLASFLDFRVLTEFTLVSVTAFSRSLSLSWEEELAEALSSLALILCSSSSSFSRSFSKVWAQLSHSGILQETAGLAKDHVQCIADYMSQCQASVLFFINSPWQLSSVFVSPGSSVFLQTGKKEHCPILAWSNSQTNGLICTCHKMAVATFQGQYGNLVLYITFL